MYNELFCKEESSQKKFTFIDLFAGIGGFHYGLSSVGGTCLMASEIDPIARETYRRNLSLVPLGDIYSIDSRSIPDSDCICAGFPCQSFSNIGNKKGLIDPRGAVFYELLRILRDKEPASFILENVVGLTQINNGEVYKGMVSELLALGYKVYSKILEANNYGLPQIRKRLFIVGINGRRNKSFEFPEPIGCPTDLSGILRGKTDRSLAFTIRIGGRRSGIDSRFNWDCYFVDGVKRYLTIEECLELQGFPSNYFLAGNTEDKYRQVGNAVPTTIVKAIGSQLIKCGVLAEP